MINATISSTCAALHPMKSLSKLGATFLHKFPTKTKPSFFLYIYYILKEWIERVSEINQPLRQSTLNRSNDISYVSAVQNAHCTICLICVHDLKINSDVLWHLRNSHQLPEWIDCCFEINQRENLHVIFVSLPIVQIQLHLSISTIDINYIY